MTPPDVLDKRLLSLVTVDTLWRAPSRKMLLVSYLLELEYVDHLASPHPRIYASSAAKRFALELLFRSFPCRYTIRSINFLFLLPWAAFFNLVSSFSDEVLAAINRVASLWIARFARKAQAWPQDILYFLPKEYHIIEESSKRAVLLVRFAHSQQ